MVNLEKINYDEIKISNIDWDKPAALCPATVRHLA